MLLIGALNTETQLVGGVLAACLIILGAELARMRRVRRRERSPEMQTLVASLIRKIEGTGPSVAQAQLQSGLEKINAATRSQIASTTGMSNGLAHRQIINSQLLVATETNAKLADLRAAETIEAEKTLKEILENEKK